jgi:transcriptional regulator with XRE-family HTH domain
MDNDLKIRLKEKMKAEKISFPRLAAALGIPKDRMYKWFQQDSKPKHEDVILIEKYLSGGMDKVPHETGILEESGAQYEQVRTSVLEESILNLTRTADTLTRSTEKAQDNIAKVLENQERLILLMEKQFSSSQSDTRKAGKRDQANLEEQAFEDVDLKGTKAKAGKR